MRNGLKITAVLLVALAALPGGTARGGPAESGFLALSGAAARGFAVPPDMRLVRSLDLEGEGLTYERYQQYFGAAQVLGAQISLFRDDSGDAVAVIGSHHPDLVATSAVSLTAAAAEQIVKRNTGPTEQRLVNLMIDPQNGRYFFQVESRGFASRWVHWADAESGQILNSYSTIEGGQGIGAKGDTKDLTGLTVYVGSGAPSNRGYHLNSSDGRQLTFDARNGTNFIWEVVDSDDDWNLVTSNRRSPGQPALVDAQYYANVTDRYLRDIHGLDWIGDCGYAAMKSVTHFGTNYNNAFWDGTYTVFGDGDGVDFREFSGSMDVVAHEYAHGVTECTSNLVYQNEPGALNESFSDINGNSAEFYANEPDSSNCVKAAGQATCADWWVAEDVDLEPDSRPGFRNMADPQEDGDPDHYSEYIVTSLDNGGVHSNSGIPNHAYYLLVNGGLNASCAAPLTHLSAHCSDGDTQDNNLNVTGLGLADAQRIFFLGFTALPADASFCAARAATKAAASALFGSGSQQAQSTTDAWRAVGLTDLVCDGPPAQPDGDSDGVTDDIDNCPNVANPSQENIVHPLTFAGDACEDPDSDGVFDATDNCPDTANPSQRDMDGDSIGNHCDDDTDGDGVSNVTDADDDADLVTDADEGACGSDSLHDLRVPERLDGAFAAADDDGDALTDEPLPPGSEDFDCDGDGYRGDTEAQVFAGATGRDQDPCGTGAWAADLAAGSFSANKVNIGDLASFISPVRRLNTSPGNDDFDPRWDVVPGTTFGEWINVQDLGSLIVLRPPLMNGGRAYNGPSCPWPP